MNLTRRVRVLEARVNATAAAATRSFSCRILLVHPEKGCTGVLVLESDKPNTQVSPTPEEIEKVRADLEKRRTGYHGLLSAPDMRND